MVDEFDASLPAGILSSPRYAATVHLKRHAVNNPRLADAVIEFVDPNTVSAHASEFGRFIHKKTKPDNFEPEKYLPSDIRDLMNDEGYPRFNFHHHTNLWKALGAQDPKKGYGTRVRKTWYWYTNWVEVVRKHCKEHAELFQ